MNHPITASMLYNLTQCPTRVALDLFEEPAKQDEVSKFVELLWERGAAFEDELIGGLEIPFTDLREQTAAEREHATTEALASGAELICGGRIRHGRLLGEPDLLRLSENGYVAGDIKSGAKPAPDGDHYLILRCSRASLSITSSTSRRMWAWSI